MMQIFHMDLWGDDGVMLNEDQLMNNLQYILNESTHPADDPIGILTSENRDIWGSAYNELIKGYLLFNFVL